MVKKIYRGKGLYQANIYLYPSLNSTNSFAKRQSLSLQNGDVIWAIEQNQGKGRQARKWKSEADNSLTFSVVLKDSRVKTLFKNISQVTSIGFCDLLKEFHIQAQIKWPNDILIAGKKVAGVLMESTPISDTFILGIGINLNSQQDFLNQIDQRATSILNESGQRIRPYELLTRLLSYLESYFDLFYDRGFAIFFNKWQEYCPLKGRQVIIEVDNQKRPAEVIRLLIDGGLEVRIGNQIKQLYTGEVFL